MDEADGSELNNTPAKLDGNASIEGKEKEKHPPRGLTLCMPCNIHLCDSMSSLSLSTAEKRSPVAKLSGVDAIVTEILKSPKRTINTIQQALQHP